MVIILFIIAIKAVTVCESAWSLLGSVEQKQYLYFPQSTVYFRPKSFANV